MKCLRRMQFLIALVVVCIWLEVHLLWQRTGRNPKHTNHQQKASGAVHPLIQYGPLDGLNYRLPGIHTYLPHIVNNPKATVPRVHISKNRTGVNLVIGMSIIRRQKSYFERTLKSVIDAMTPGEAKHCLIMVLVAEPWNETFVNSIVFFNLVGSFQPEIESGLLDIMVPPASFYPGMEDLTNTFNDSSVRMRWRTKQNLDYSFLMLQAYKRGKYYIQLEDDITAKSNFVSFINGTIHTQKSWMVLKFCALGFIGNLFRSEDLPLVLEFILMFHKIKPVDWLLDDLMATLVCGQSIDTPAFRCEQQRKKIFRVISPAQFQHIGVVSSLKGKRQRLLDFSYRGPRQLVDLRVNTSGVHTSMVGWKYRHLKNIMQNQLKPQLKPQLKLRYPIEGDVFDICFRPFVILDKLTVISGEKIEPGNNTIPGNTTIPRNSTFLPSTTIEILPFETPPNLSALKVDLYTQPSVCGPGDFYRIGDFDVTGRATVTRVPSALRKSKVVRIHVREDHPHYVLISTVRVNEN